MCPKNSGETSWTYRDISYYLVGGLTHNVCTFVVPRLCISALISSVIFKKKRKKKRLPCLFFVFSVAFLPLLESETMTMVRKGKWGET